MKTILLVAVAGVLFVTVHEARSVGAEEEASSLAVIQVARIGTPQFQHGTAISQLWFPANDCVVSAGGQRFRAWNAESGELNNEIQCPQYSRPTFDGGRRVLVAEPLVNGVRTHAFRVVDLVTGRQVSRWLHPEWAETSAIRRGGAFAVLGNLAHTVSVVDVQTGQEIDRIRELAPRGKAAGYPKVMLSPNSRILAVLARPDHVQFFELGATGKVQRPLATIANQSFHKLVFSPNGDDVLLVGNRTSSLWNVRSSQQVSGWIEPDANLVSDVVFAKQGTIVAELTGTVDGIVRIRDAQSGKELRSFPLHARPRCFCIALSPDESVLAAGGYQELVRLYDFETGKEVHLDDDAHMDGPMESAAISDDGSWIASTEFKGVVSLWNGKDGWKRTVVRDDDIRSKFMYDTSAGPNFLTFLSGKAGLLAGSGIYHNSVNVWDPVTRKRKFRFVGHGMPIAGVAASRDGKVLASISANDTLRIWARDGNQLHQIKAGRNSLALSPDGSLVAVSLHREGPVRGRNGIPEPSLPVPTVELWSTATGKLVRSFSEASGAPYPSYGFYSVTLSHNGRLVAAIAKSGLHVWDVATGELVRSISVSQPAAELTAWHAPNCGCAFSPIRNIIAVPRANGSILFFDLDSKADEPVAVVKGHDGPVNSVAWRRDGRYMVSAGNDSTILLWQVQRNHADSGGT